MATSTLNRAEYQQKLQAELDKLDGQIEEFQAKAKQAGAESKIQYSNAVEELKMKQQVAENKLKEFQNASEEAWAEMQEGLDQVWKDLETTFNKVAAKFQDDQPSTR